MSTTTTPNLVFQRVTVDNIVRGGTRIFWTINPHFLDPLPWTFQLQTAEADIDSATWTNVGPPVSNAFIATDTTQRVFGKNQAVFYRVVLSTIKGTYISPTGRNFGALSFRWWNRAQEIVRKKNLQLVRQNQGIAGYLLKAILSGVPCPACLDQYTGEVTDSNCTTCYGTRWTGGYYTPVPTVFGDVAYHARAAKIDLSQGEGIVEPQIVKGVFVASPFIVTGDIWVNAATDVRYRIWSVSPVAQVQSTPLIFAAEMRTIPFDNVIYNFVVPTS